MNSSNNNTDTTTTTTTTPGIDAAGGGGDNPQRQHEFNAPPAAPAPAAAAAAKTTSGSADADNDRNEVMGTATGTGTGTTNAATKRPEATIPNPSSVATQDANKTSDVDSDKAETNNEPTSPTTAETPSSTTTKKKTVVVMFRQRVAMTKRVLSYRGPVNKIHFATVIEAPPDHEQQQQQQSQQQPKDQPQKLRCRIRYDPGYKLPYDGLNGNGNTKHYRNYQGYSRSRNSVDNSRNGSYAVGGSSSGLAVEEDLDIVRKARVLYVNNEEFDRNPPEFSVPPKLPPPQAQAATGTSTAPVAGSATAAGLTSQAHNQPEFETPPPSPVVNTTHPGTAPTGPPPLPVMPTAGVAVATAAANASRMPPPIPMMPMQMIQQQRQMAATAAATAQMQYLAKMQHLRNAGGNVAAHHFQQQQQHQMQMQQLRQQQQRPQSYHHIQQQQPFVESRTAARTSVSGRALPPTTGGVGAAWTTTTTNMKSPSKQPAAKAAKTATPNKPKGAAASVLEWEGRPPAEEYPGDGDDWPQGWTKQLVRRLSGTLKGKCDPYWITPEKKYKLRSMAELKRFLHALSLSNGDEVAAWKNLKGK